MSQFEDGPLACREAPCGPGQGEGKLARSKRPGRGSSHQGGEWGPFLIQIQQQGSISSNEAADSL